MEEQDQDRELEEKQAQEETKYANQYEGKKD